MSEAGARGRSEIDKAEERTSWEAESLAFAAKQLKVATPEAYAESSRILFRVSQLRSAFRLQQSMHQRAIGSRYATYNALLQQIEEVLKERRGRYNEAQIKDPRRPT